MAWEKRGNREYYYKSVRVEGEPRKICWGTGAVGRAHEQHDRLTALQKAEVREQQLLIRGPIEQTDRLWTDLWSWVRLLAESYLLLAGWYCHRGQWRRMRRQPRTRQNRRPVGIVNPSGDLRTQLRSLNAHAHGGEVESLAALQLFLEGHPEIGQAIQDLIAQSRRLWTRSLGVELDSENSSAELSNTGLSNSAGVSLEDFLSAAVGIAKRNRRHAAGLLDAESSGLAITTRMKRREQAENRIRDAERLLARVRAVSNRHQLNIRSVGPPEQSR